MLFHCHLTIPLFPYIHWFSSLYRVPHPSPDAIIPCSSSPLFPGKYDSSKRTVSTRLPILRASRGSFSTPYAGLCLCGLPKPSPKSPPPSRQGRPRMRYTNKRPSHVNYAA
ncbi:hypothetical protein KNP414_07174 [Paenibacillus mucilaginosus KNP414]|uniref:Uncharacterized protein n=1 Tax=Paenibacillus mucilaginosus (strain KNP414) TaxID=1036673 RepID=F8FM58_PAEMK|nr:hypothetical protein KNP414_07174 [Paenibacillus mucilaginosus KNP414]